MYNKLRMVFGVEGGLPIRVQPHETKPGILVVKAPEMQVFTTLGAMMDGFKFGEAMKGSNFYRVEVEEAAFSVALGKCLTTLMSMERQAFTAYKSAEADKKATVALTVIQGEGLGLAPGVQKCDECGVTDGAHWQFCEHHEGA